MINQVILVGRLTKKPDLILTDSGKKASFITLAVGRPYKNVNGEYDTDFLDCILWTGIAENTAEYCSKGDIIGVRGRLQSRLVENEDGSKIKKVEIIADKVTFLSTNKNASFEKVDCNNDDNLVVDKKDTSTGEKNNKIGKKK